MRVPAPSPKRVLVPHINGLKIGLTALRFHRQMFCLAVYGTAQSEQRDATGKTYETRQIEARVIDQNQSFL